MPRQIGIANVFRGKVTYRESPPPPELAQLVCCTWELKTQAPLPQDFLYFILPDACTDIIFDLQATAGAEQVFMMSSGTHAIEINLGKNFHFVGIRLYPGVFDGKTDVAASPDTTHTWQQLHQTQTESQRQNILQSYAGALYKQAKLKKNLLMYRVLSGADQPRKVSDLQVPTGYTARQLQRLFAQQTGFTPRDFLKIVRFQRALADNPDHYADQSHLIKEFKRITGMTPTVFKTKY